MQSSDGMSNVLWRNNMTFKKETGKIVSLQMKCLVHFYHPPVTLFEKGTKYCGVAILWKEMNWKFIFLWRKINWYGLQIAKHNFIVTCSILNMELMNIILIVLMEFACIRHRWTLQQINLTVCSFVLLWCFSLIVY